MGNFNRGGGGNHFGGRGGRPEFNKQMHRAVCSECNRSCEVPFRPTNGKPVYCKDCFASKGGDMGNKTERTDRFPRREYSDNNSSRPNFGDANKGNGDVLKKIEELNVKIDRLTQAVQSLSDSQPKNTEDAPKEAPKKILKKKAANKKG